MAEDQDVVVIGGGQAGLVASHALTERGLGHVVLERDRVGGRWRTERWDSLRFQFPNVTLGLPGMPYDGPDAESFAHHTDVLAWLARYATLIDAPVREHTAVTSLDQQEGAWWVRTTDGEFSARTVVVATGPFQRARVPTISTGITGGLQQMHSVHYRNPDQLPPGAVLVVGSGASGSQIAEELATTGRSTYLCVSRHRRVPRRYRGRDITNWLIDLGFMDRARADWVDGSMPPTVLVTGVDGGHDMDLRILQERGVTLLGSLVDVIDDVAHFRDDAEPILAAADTMYDELLHAIERHTRAPGAGIPVPVAAPHPEPVPARPTLSLRDQGISSVIWATGYDFDYDWLHAPVIDSDGRPTQRRGVTEVPGLYFLGLHWMHTFKSGTFMGIGEDAAHVADHLAVYLRSR